MRISDKWQWHDEEFSYQFTSKINKYGRDYYVFKVIAFLLLPSQTYAIILPKDLVYAFKDNFQLKSYLYTEMSNILNIVYPERIEVNESK